MPTSIPTSTLRTAATHPATDAPNGSGRGTALCEAVAELSTAGRQSCSLSFTASVRPLQESAQ